MLRVRSAGSLTGRSFENGRRRKVEMAFFSDGTSCVVAEFNEDGTSKKTYIEET